MDRERQIIQEQNFVGPPFERPGNPTIAEVRADLVAMQGSLKAQETVTKVKATAVVQ